MFRFSPQLPITFFVAGAVISAAGCKSNGSAELYPDASGAAGTAASMAGSTGSGGSVGTGGSGGDGGAIAFSRSELLGAFGSCAASGVKDFRARATALDAAVATYVATPDDVSKAAAREAFRAAMVSWQAMDMLQFGPTGSSAYVPGGKGFRDHIYAWPTFGRCLIEEALVARTYESNFAALGYNRRTLAAAEYLLFYEGNDSACTGASLAAWDAVAAEERAARKRAYAAAVIKDVLARAVELDVAWDPAGMNFVQTMQSAGSGNPVYPTVQKAIESVGLAVFYLDRVLKDEKVSKPINNSNNCALGCFESQFARLSKPYIRANLEGFRNVMEGCGPDHSGYGFDDLLASINAGALADTLRAQALAAEAALEAIAEPNLDQALAANPAGLQPLRTAIGELTTTVKTSLYTTLNFEPTLIPTDND